ncbi:cytochrome P450 CYP736A12-like [Cucurbita maxima]|uniref:Cytochrome P450 CYP736A12-like n=1 Tax=Cucurbita maxima TaxID=3661 RepID=A0A6J1KZP5_CUCMA|nr:cytochrome P450 CYP736A12-like [Cucurbita maxima]
MAWVSAFIVISILLAFLLNSWLSKMNIKKLPPGPKGFPIIGTIHLLKKLVHRDLHHLSQLYGPIMHMKLGLKSTIIVSSSHAAELFLKAHDPVFAGRPVRLTFNQLSYHQKNIAFAQYGPYWRNMRKICILQLFTTLKMNSFTSMRREEVGLLIDHLQEAAKMHGVVDLSSQISSFIADVICRMVFGRKFVEEEFKASIHEATLLVGAPDLGDFIPFISMLDLQGLGRRAKGVTKVFDGFLDMIIKQHLESNDENRTKGCFLDVLLDSKIDHSSIKGVIMDLIIGGVDSSRTTIDWALSELIKHPHTMKKVQKELENVVGLGKMVEESDLRELKYLEMVIKETFRMHPPIPLIPRKCIEDCIVNGYHIPKNSEVLINEWAIGRDPCVWFDPLTFFPERFANRKMDTRGKDFQLHPFGYGCRNCPGMQLGLVLVQLVVAQLVHWFDLELPNGISPSELDMTEQFGLTCTRAHNLRVILVRRAPN